MIPKNNSVLEDCRQVLEGSFEMLEQLRGGNLLVTGGTGFMGTWIAEMVACLNDRYNFGIKLFLLSSRANSFISKAPHLAVRHDVVLLEQDIRTFLELPDEINWVIHAAGNPDSRLHVSDPVKTLDVIVNGTLSFFNALTRLPQLTRVLSVSSGLVYGTHSDYIKATAENDWGSVVPCSVGSVYIEAKRCMESIVTAYSNEYRIPVVIARPFAFIGPYQLLDKPWAINNFMRDCLLGQPIRVLGDPNVVRSYLYASDMAFWMLRILACGKNGASYNVGSPVGVTIRELANKISTQSSQPIDVHFTMGHMANGNTNAHLLPNVSLAQKTLGLKVTVDLDAAISKTLLWNKMNL